MADTSENSISLKALVDKESNKVIFIESDYDFVDVLFSFLTIPMGTIIKLGRSRSAPVGIGCMKNLYSSVESIQVPHFRAEGYRSMLLCPRNGAHSYCENLKLKIDNEPTGYFLCSSTDTNRCKLFSHYKGVLCECKKPMDYVVSVLVGDSENTSFVAQYGGVFLNGVARFIISDDLQVMRAISSSVSSLFTKIGVVDASTTEEKTLNVGVDEVLNLLMCSFVSKTSLSDTLLPDNKLKDELEQKVINEIFYQGISIKPRMEGDTANEGNSISVKLMVSKSKNMVCYAEAGEDFVNLLFSFLTLPLGFVLKHMHNSSVNGCIDQLYKSVQNFDEQYLKSNYSKEMLLSPKLYPGFCYENYLLGIENAPLASYSLKYYPYSVVELKYCKSSNDGGCRKGFLNGPMLFTVTDSLIIRPISPLFSLSVMNELKVSFADLEEQVVQVGKEEALRLLVTSFLCDSALTNVFLKQSKTEQ